MKPRNVTCGHCIEDGHTFTRCPLRHLTRFDAMEATAEGRKLLDLWQRFAVGGIASELGKLPPGRWAGLLEAARNQAAERHAYDRRQAAERAPAPAPVRQHAPVELDHGPELVQLLAEVGRSLADLEADHAAPTGPRPTVRARGRA